MCSLQFRRMQCAEGTLCSVRRVRCAVCIMQIVQIVQRARCIVECAMCIVLVHCLHCLKVRLLKSLHAPGIHVSRHVESTIL